MANSISFLLLLLLVLLRLLLRVARVRVEVLGRMSPNSLRGIVFSSQQRFVSWESILRWDLSPELSREVNEVLWAHLLWALGSPLWMESLLFSQQQT
jgi:hypothetical protein